MRQTTLRLRLALRPRLTVIAAQYPCIYLDRRVALSGNSPQPASKYPAGGPDQPAKSSGSPTYPLDTLAALSADHKYLIVSVVNATESEAEIRSERHRGPCSLAIDNVAVDGK